MNISINRVFPGTQNQKNVGIFATVVLDVQDDNGVTITQLNEIILRKSREGAYFLAAPSKEAGKDPQTNITRYRNYFKIFPLSDNEDMNNAQKDRMRELTSQVVSVMEREESSSSSQQSSPPPSSGSTAATTAW